MSATSFAAASVPRRWERVLDRAVVNLLVDVGLFAFCAAMLVAMEVHAGEETIPYHVLFFVLTVAYGFRVWPLVPTMIVIVVVTAATATIMYTHYREGFIVAPELAEIPLMPALLVAMVWHARRRAVAQQSLQEMADEQWVMLDRQRELFRNTSHAIRTPVTIARGHLELAAGAIIEGRARDDVDVALRQLDRMALLSNRLLALAQLDAGRTLLTQRIHFRDFFLELGRSWMAAGSRTWVINSPEEDAVVVGDPEWLSLAVDALVENAVRFTQDGGRIELTGVITPTHCTIRVRDDGPGVEAADLDHVFERFWHRRPPQGSMGSGLGLAIVRATARACRGTARVHNDPRGGAVFEINLPRVTSEAQVDRHPPSPLGVGHPQEVGAGDERA